MTGHDGAIQRMTGWEDMDPGGPPGDVPSNVSVVPLGGQSKEYLVRPPGYRYRNRHGLEFEVIRYAKFGFGGAPAYFSDGSRDLELYHGNRPAVCALPVIAHRNASERLKQLYREILAVTPKKLVLADASGLPERCRQIMYGLHFTSWRESPKMMNVMIDSNVCREDIMGHELMHIWLDLVEGYEDHRSYRDAANGRNFFAVTTAQSFVVDCKVQEKLKKRGFPLRPSVLDIVDGLCETAAALDLGVEFRNRTQECAVARVLSRPWAVPELYDLTEADWEKIRFARTVFERRLPRLARLADRFTRAFGERGYSGKPGALKLIDECLKLQFAYLGEDFDIKRDLVVQRDALEYQEEVLRLVFGPPHGMPGCPSPGGWAGALPVGRKWKGNIWPHVPPVPRSGNAVHPGGNAGGGPPCETAQHWGAAPHVPYPSTHGANGLPLRTVPGAAPSAASPGQASPPSGPHAGYRPPVPGVHSGPMEGPSRPGPTFTGPPGTRPENGMIGLPSAPGGPPGVGGPPFPGRPKRP